MKLNKNASLSLPDIVNAWSMINENFMYKKKLLEHIIKRLGQEQK